MTRRMICRAAAALLVLGAGAPESFGDADDPGTIAVSGTVRDFTGAPVAGAKVRVEVFRDRVREADVEFCGRSRTVLADARGVYAASLPLPPGIPPRDLTVRVTAAKLAGPMFLQNNFERVRLTDAHCQGDRGVLSADVTLRVGARYGVVVTGTVRDATSGQPVPGVVVSLGHAEVSMTTDAAGEYFIAVPLREPTGTLPVNVRKSANAYLDVRGGVTYGIVQQSLPVTSGGTLALDFDLPRVTPQTAVLGWIAEHPPGEPLPTRPLAHASAVLTLDISPRHHMCNSTGTWRMAAVADSFGHYQVPVSILLTRLCGEPVPVPVTFRITQATLKTNGMLFQPDQDSPHAAEVVDVTDRLVNSDGTLKTGQVFDVDFALRPKGASNRPPTLAPIGNRTIEAGRSLVFSLSATDPDGDPLIFNAANLPHQAVFYAAAGTFSWTPHAGQVGAHQMIFAAFDGGREDSEVVTVTVQENRAELKDQIRERDAWIAHLTQTQAQLTAERQELRQALTDLSAQRLALHAEAANLQTTLTATRERLNAAERRVAAGTEQLQRLGQERRHLVTQLAEVQTAFDRATTTIGQLETKRQELEGLRRTLAETEQQLVRTAQERDRRHQDAQALATQMTATKQDLAATREQLDTTGVRLARTMEQFTALGQDKTALEQRLTQLRQAQEQLAGTLADAKGDVAQVTQERAQLEEAHTELARQLQSANEREAQLSQQLTELQSSAAAAEVPTALEASPAITTVVVPYVTGAPPVSLVPVSSWETSRHPVPPPDRADTEMPGAVTMPTQPLDEVLPVAEAQPDPVQLRQEILDLRLGRDATVDDIRRRDRLVSAVNRLVDPIARYALWELLAQRERRAHDEGETPP